VAGPGARLFGLNLATTFPFATTLPPPAGPADLLLEVISEAPPPPPGPPLYKSLARTGDGGPAFALHRDGPADVLRFPGPLEFRIDSARITARAPAGTPPHRVEIAFLGTVMAFVLERRGALALHASAVETERGAVLFLGGNHGGKTALAAALLRNGRALVADDIAALEAGPEGIVVRPGYPSMRMWPDEADWFLGAHAHLPLVHPDLDKRRVVVGPGSFGRFLDRTTTLSRVYLPERGGVEAPAILPVASSEALFALLGGAFLARLMEAAGDRARRLELLARIVREGRVRRLRIPEGFARLPEAAGAVLADA
jgi:hypothetical protein